MNQPAAFGRLLGAAAGYRVVSPDGRELGRIDHIVYQQHAEHPDELVVGHRWLRWRQQPVPFSAIATVNRRDQSVLLKSNREHE